MFSSFWRNRMLIWQMTKRDVVGRYRGSVMGLVWSFLHPVLMLTVYTFVFSVVFKARWGGGSDSKTEFAIVLFAGMIINGLFSECLNKAPSLVTSNPNYVKKVVFPLEILPWVSMGSSLFHSLVSLIVLMTLYALVNMSLNWTLMFLPLLLLPLIILTVGLSWFLASFGVFLRDVGQTIGILTTVLMFLSPVFYSRSSLPEEYQKILLLNPMTFMIEQTRDVMIWGNLPDWNGLLLYSACSILIASSGFFWFQKTRKGFADVL